MSYWHQDPEDEANADPDYAMTCGWKLGERGQLLTDDDLIPWPPRLRPAFKHGWRGGYEWFREHKDDHDRESRGDLR